MLLVRTEHLDDGGNLPHELGLTERSGAVPQRRQVRLDRLADLLMAGHMVEVAPKQEVLLQAPSIKEVGAQPECGTGDPLSIVAGGAKSVLNPVAKEVEGTNQHQAEDADSANCHNPSPNIDIHGGLGPAGISG